MRASCGDMMATLRVMRKLQRVRQKATFFSTICGLKFTKFGENVGDVL